MPPTTLIICGTGSAAHVIAASFASNPSWTPMLVSLSNRGAEMREAMHPDKTLVLEDPTSNNNAPSVASLETLRILAPSALPAVLADTPSAQPPLVVLSIPAFAHEPYLQAVLPHLPPASVVLLMPAYACADLLVRATHAALPRDTRPPRLHVALADQLPWVARTQQFGRRVKIHGHKRSLRVTAVRLVDEDDAPCKGGPFAAPDDVAVATLKAFFAASFRGTVSLRSGVAHALALALFQPNAILHTTLLRGFYLERLDADSGFEEVPFFYAETSDATGALLDAMSAETLNVRDALVRCAPRLADGLADVVTFRAWIRGACAGSIEDETTTASCIRTNAATRALKHPMRCGADGRWRTDWGYRYVVEDFPCGMLPVKSVAQVVGVATPVLDSVIRWAQERTGAQWICGDRVHEKATLGPSRVLQRFDIHSLESLLALYDAVDE